MRNVWVEGKRTGEDKVLLCRWQGKMALGKCSGIFGVLVDEVLLDLRHDF